MKMKFQLMKMKFLLMKLRLMEHQVTRLRRQVLASSGLPTSSIDVARSATADSLPIVGHGVPQPRPAWLINHSALVRQARR